MAMILVTGATGQLGSATIEYLLQKTNPQNIVAFVRDAQKANHLASKGVTLCIGNYNDPGSVSQAMQGIDILLLISGLEPNRLQQHQQVIDAAVQAGVQHVLYTGVAMTDTAASAIRKMMDDHTNTEAYILAKGISYTFLRNSLYADGLPGFTGEKAPTTGIHFPAGDGKVPYVWKKDLAEATAHILTSAGHENKIYKLTGGPSYSFHDIAAMFTAITGTPTIYSNPSASQYAETLQQYNVPAMFIKILGGFAEDIKNNLYDIPSNDLEQLLGRPPLALANAIKEIYKL
ncbi:NAD(P)H dehydrogenase (quinone) [Chitinophaga skermanii]|uniref:NAD(P)H dehydrogenase (Quinone) n=1 Tax=Chitinophaga skermanii TaxID=331697 RepID=A0A327QN59_9BACT|nr:SDR family oxidoreductase [Chitinophaga skermanii]RAJ05478.1 NAD(P)H dehydrogenase (quinone) [Chitinophaga skermanii]